MSTLPSAGNGLIYDPARAVRLRAQVEGLAYRAHSRWMAVSLDGMWITAAGMEDTHGGPAIIWRSSDDLMLRGDLPKAETPARHLLLGTWDWQYPSKEELDGRCPCALGGRHTPGFYHGPHGYPMGTRSLDRT